MTSHRLLITLVILVACLFTSGQILADTLVLNDGQRIQGKFVGRTADGVNFEVGGQTMEFKNTNVQSIEFGSTPPPAEAPAETAQPTEAPIPAEAAPPPPPACPGGCAR